MPRCVLRDRGEELENPKLDAVGAVEGDGGPSDTSDREEGGDLEDEDELGPGSLVWASVQRYHPALVVAPSESLTINMICRLHTI